MRSAGGGSSFRQRSIPSADAHSRTLYEAGVEKTLTRHFRAEAYLAWQKDYQPQQDSLRALGLVAKWYY